MCGVSSSSDSDDAKTRGLFARPLVVAAVARIETINLSSLLVQNGGALCIAPVAGKDVRAALGALAVRLGLGTDLRISKKDGDLGINMFFVFELRPPAPMVPHQKTAAKLLDLGDDALGDLNFGLPGGCNAVGQVLGFDQAAEHDVARMGHGRLGRPKYDVVQTGTLNDRVKTKSVVAGILDVLSKLDPLFEVRRFDLSTLRDGQLVERDAVAAELVPIFGVLADMHLHSTSCPPQHDSRKCSKDAIKVRVRCAQMQGHHSYWQSRSRVIHIDLSKVQVRHSHNFLLVVVVATDSNRFKIGVGITAGAHDIGATRRCVPW